MNNLGIEVSLLFRADLPLKGFDKDVRVRLMSHMVNCGIKVHPASKFHSIEKMPEGAKVKLTGRTFEFDSVLFIGIFLTLAGFPLFNLIG